MPDRRSVDDLSIEELEQILAIRKRQAREATLRRLQGEGRIVDGEFANEVLSRPATSAGEAPADPIGSRYRTAEIASPSETRRPRVFPWRAVRDRFLLLIEIGALIGLVLVVVGIEQTRQELNRDVAVARNVGQSSAEPTPVIRAVVLPSGHKPPTSPGGAAPNFDEIPAHLRAYVQSVTPLPIPTRGPGQPTRIVIPALGVDGNVVQGTDWEQLKKGVGHYLNTANPGERGNLVLAGHNDVFGEIFRDLDKLKVGDEIMIYSVDRAFRYVVTETRIVEPTQVEVMDPTSEPTATLISCYPYLVDTQRIVVFAALQS
ncbi:MAG TPA: class D sortase [Anaerolineae bacterium]|nr:class D sortase [Anaerolineae bacterium]